MCNVMVSDFKRNQKVQRNERQSRYERYDPSRSDEVYQSTGRAIIVEKIRDEETRSEQTELREIIRLEQSEVKASGEKRGKYDQRENTTQREKSHAKRENKSVARILEKRVRKVVWSRAQ